MISCRKPLADRSAFFSNSSSHSQNVVANSAKDWLRFADYNFKNGNSASHPEQQQRAKQMGLTSAISWDKPTIEELQRTEALRKALQPFKVFENQNELNRRVQILAKLNTLAKKWVKVASMAKNVPEAVAEKLGAKVYTFGSYRLGVHHKGADIDALFVAPRNIERTEFFTSFFELLKNQSEVTECRSVEEAFVPVIKMKFDGIEIDLVFARLSLKEIPDDLDLSDDYLLKNLDQFSVRSLNGCRVTDEILALVPNVENFRLTLRSIKLWAKKHGVYSNSLGYFGGVTWAMLVARTCQLYPNATPSTLIHKFFLILSLWKWPKPVLLKRPVDVDLRFPVWDPRVNGADRYHLMPIITPAYPQQNSTFNVSESTKKVLLNEFSRGKIIVEEIMNGRASWDRLFEAPSFFYKYRHFIAVLVTSQTSDDQLEWCGLVESRIRLLVCNLERTHHIALAHANPTCFDYKKGAAVTLNNSGSEEDKTQPNGDPPVCTAPFCSMWFIGLEFERTENLNVDLTQTIKYFVESVIMHAIKIQMFRDGMNIDAQYVKRKSLSQYLDTDLLKRERRSMEQESSFNNSISANCKRLLTDLSTQKELAAKKARLSESTSSED
ncbi:poly(A) polymerase type 3-like [Anastrepha ludens]|uniref:poly(A) polymerase type 3-like n=1 Tax=Anastrepha ludens TaxID=28586 RepID=UPI0023AF2FA1|nr:poly(A) polymerase type 3-like [Anastrepha ludens]